MSKKPIKIGIFLPTHFSAALATTLYDYLCTANLVAAQKLFDVRFFASNEKAVAYSGIVLTASTQIPKDLDLLVVVGTGGASKSEVWSNLNSDAATVHAVIRAAKKNGAVIAAACTGTFYLAGSGLLNAKPATCAWWLLDEIRHAFPQVRWNAKKNLIAEGKLITVGAGFSAIELAKLILARFKLGRLERKVHRILLLPERPIEQHPYLALTETIAGEFAMELQKILDQVGWALSPEEMADKLHLSPRTFARKFKMQMKTTPGKWLQLKRLEKAKSLLMSSSLSVEETCYQVGYQDTSSFIRLFQREVGISPGEFRLSFRK